MMHRIKYCNKSLVESGGGTVLLLLKSQLERRLVVSDVGGGVFSSAPMGSRRFFSTRGGGITTESSSSLEPTKKKKSECQIISSKLQRERCDEISSIEVSLNQFPGLMVNGIGLNSETRRLLRLNPDTGFFEEQDVAAAANHHGHYDLQVPNRHVCRGSAYGWLFLTDDNLDMKLLNPFSGAEIQLPPVETLPPVEEKNKEKQWDLSKWYVCKAVFSANPSIEPRPVVLIIYGGQYYPRLAFCKPGDKGWTPLEFPKFSIHMDAIYHKGQFYVLGWPGYIAAFDIGRRIDDDDHSVKTVVVATAPKRRVRWREWHLVMLDGELVRFELKQLCLRYCCIMKSMRFLEKERKRGGDTTDEECCYADYSDEECFNGEYTITEMEDKPLWSLCVSYYLFLRHHTYGIKIRRFDASEKQWVKVESLGDKAVFLGYNTSFALSASDYPAGVCIPNSVYFSYGAGGNQLTEKRFYDMGIYNVKDKTVKPIYPPMDDEGKDASHVRKPAPIWIVNSLC